MKKFLAMLVLMCMQTSSWAWVGSWSTKGGDALIGLSTEPSNPDVANNSYLIIGYSKANACRPVVSVLILRGQRLGAPIKQRTSKSRKNQLVVSVSGVEYTNETKMTEYSNGTELAMIPPDGLIVALSSNSASLSAVIGNTSILNFKKASNFSTANANAKKNCK